MRFLLDEDIPRKLLHVLRAAGHDVLPAPRATPDPAIAHLANTSGSILVSLDKDFTNTSLYPPSQFTIIHIQLHPPYADVIIEAFTKLLATLPPEEFHGLIILHRSGVLRISA